MIVINESDVVAFTARLKSEEKSTLTIEKYIRDVRAFVRWLDGREVDKTTVLDYKAYLCKRYAVSSVNSVISSINNFFNGMQMYSLRVKTIKTQKQLFTTKDKELTKNEYERLLSCAKERGQIRLYLIMQTICSCGIRISELQFITAESLKIETADIACKGKNRRVILPSKLCKMLVKYTKEQKINSGPVFVSGNGNPLNRSNIWHDMKALCRQAGVPEAKVFPHNLRHLFARTYYSVQKDVVRLADILGHSNVNTTRIYTIESGEIHRRQIQSLGLIQGDTT